MAALEEPYSASFESESSIEEEQEESVELGKTAITASHDPFSRQRNNNEEKSKEGVRHIKKRQHQEDSAQKPPLGQRVSTSRNRISIEMTGVSAKKEQKSIPRSVHINSGGRASENSLALSDQCRQNPSQSSQLRDAVFAEWLAEKGSHMKKEKQVAALKKQQQEREKTKKKARSCVKYAHT